MKKTELKEKPLEELVELFEQTTGIEDEKTIEVRGWLLEAIYEKNPEGVNTWLDAPDFADNTLKNYIL